MADKKESGDTVKITRTRATSKVKKVVEEIVPEKEVYISLLDQFVFMDKAKNILDVGLKTGKNVILYGPGGHGKSELATEFLYDKDINPFIITMGQGMSTDRLFGGLDISQLQTGGSGKIEYLIENSFMNHEYVIFEEMMDAPPYILEQLKDILSSGVFRNGTQVFRIKTRFIICCTNKTRAEFSKNDSLKALMERFPLELNVVWDNYTEASYLTLLEKRYGKGTIDPIIPFLLQEYHKENLTISPRIALDAYDIYQECGPDALPFIADFAKKPTLISEALVKWKGTVDFKKIGVTITELIAKLTENKITTDAKRREFISVYDELTEKFRVLKTMTVPDDLSPIYASMVRVTNDNLTKFSSTYSKAQDKIDSL